MSKNTRGRARRALNVLIDYAAILDDQAIAATESNSRVVHSPTHIHTYNVATRSPSPEIATNFASQESALESHVLKDLIKSLQEVTERVTRLETQNINIEAEIIGKVEEYFDALSQQMEGSIESPYVVREIKGPATYIVHEPTSNKVRGMFHANDLKAYRDPRTPNEDLAKEESNLGAPIS
ncbi:hypothetical protein KM043_004793 [Ampulex compressa]|nr:hypothetical protein KM043_004793 [Ampulex compressa]